MASDDEVLRLLQEVHASGGARELLLMDINRRVTEQSGAIAAVQVDVGKMVVHHDALTERVERLEKRDEDHISRCQVVGPLTERVRRLEDHHEQTEKARIASLEKSKETRSAWVKWGWERIVAVLIAAGTLFWGWFTTKKNGH